MFILIFFVVFLSLIVLASLLLASKVIFPKRFGFEETFNIEKENGKIDETEYLSWEKEQVWIDSRYGYPVHGFYFPIFGSKKTVLFSHGITYTLFGSVKYMKIFRDLKFNILIYDNRFHGKSGGKNCTFGFFEKYDLETITTWVLNKIGKDSLIGTHGESMGAAISLQHAAIDPRIQFVIEDCSFSKLEDLLAFRIKKDYNLGKFPFLYLAMFLIKLVTGMDVRQVSPEAAVSKSSAPILFIHGDSDDFIPTDMVKELYTSKTSGAKKLYIAPNAAHAESFWNNQEEYTKIVNEFLAENHLI